jgi:hypothetical protein
MEETAEHFEKRFFINRFLSTFQNFMPHIEIMKFCQNHWSLMCSPINRQVNTVPTRPMHLRSVLKAEKTEGQFAVEEWKKIKTERDNEWNTGICADEARGTNNVADEVGGTGTGTEEVGGTKTGADEVGGTGTGADKAGGTGSGADDAEGTGTGADEAGGTETGADEAGGQKLAQVQMRQRDRNWRR